MRRHKIIVLTTIVVIAFCSCNKVVQLDPTKNHIMEVNGNVLSYDDIVKVMPEDLSGQDSAIFVENYKKRWATNILMYDKALRNVGSTDEINELAEIYRRELIINEYQQQLIDQEMPELNEDSIMAFYEKQKEHFPLEEAIVKGIFIKILTSTPNQSKLSRWLSNINDENLDNIMRFCTKTAIYYDFLMIIGVLLEISSLLPEKMDANDPALSRGTVVLQSDEYSYYLKIIGICQAGEPKPYEFIRPELMNITNKQKIDFIHNFQEDLYQRHSKTIQLLQLKTKINRHEKTTYITFLLICITSLMPILSSNQIIDQVVWVIGDEPILKSDIETEILRMRYEKQSIDGDPYCNT